jgi:hypothetical protein
MSERAIVLPGLIAAALLYLFLALGGFLGDGVSLVGDKVYDYYFLALSEGRFDIPARVATLEGHYDAEGRAYVYHGVAPVLTRAILSPFVDLRAADWVAGVSVWAFAFLGTLALHLSFRQLLASHGPKAPRLRLTWTVIGGLAVWICSPGLLLSANHSVFHEPTSVAYFCVMWSVFLYARVVFHGTEPWRVALPLAVLAGLALLGRPQMAVGLYLGLGLLGLTHLRRHGLARPGIMAGTVAILMAFGLGLLAFNAARFGNPLQMFGSNDAGAVQYGFTYWGLESETETARMDAFIQHGTFNFGRLLPNLMLYGIDLPWGALTGNPMDIEAGPINAFYRDISVGMGFIRVEAPRIGLLYYWAPWIAMALVGVVLPRAAGPRFDSPRGWIPLMATGVMAIFILTYGTVTLRYRFEVFPFLAVLGLLGLSRILAWQARKDRFGWGPLVLVGGGTLGATLISLGVSVIYADNFPQLDPVSAWSRETCERLVLQKGFAETELDRLCGL